MSDPTEEDLSAPIGLVVRRSGPPQLWGLAASLLARNAPCYGNFRKEAATCQPGTCVVRDPCRIALGSLAQLEALSLEKSDRESADVQVPPTPVQGTLPAFRKGRVRTDGVKCFICEKEIPRGDCLVGKGNTMVHTSCGEPSV